MYLSCTCNFVLTWEFRPEKFQRIKRMFQLANNTGCYHYDVIIILLNEVWRRTVDKWRVTSQAWQRQYYVTPLQECGVALMTSGVWHTGVTWALLRQTLTSEVWRRTVDKWRVTSQVCKRQCCVTPLTREVWHPMSSRVWRHKRTTCFDGQSVTSYCCLAGELHVWWAECDAALVSSRVWRHKRTTCLMGRVWRRTGV